MTPSTTPLRRLAAILPGVALLLLGSSSLRADNLFIWDILNTSASGAATYTIAGNATAGAWGTGSGITNESSTKVAATGNTLTSAGGKGLGLSITNGAFLEFSITAGGNYNLTLTNLGTTMFSSQNAGASGSGPYQLSLLYSSTGDFKSAFSAGTYTNMSTGGTNINLTSLAANVSSGLGGAYLAANNLTIAAGTTAYFALVYQMSSNNSASSYTTWYSTNSSGNDFSILGTALQLAAPKNLVWGGGDGTWAVGSGGWLSNGVATNWAAIDSATISSTSGTLTVSNATGAGTVTVNNASGTVTLTNGSLVLSGDMVKSGNGTLSSGTALIVSGSMTNSAGATILNGTNNITGALVVSGGSLIANSNTAVGNGITVTNASATFNASNSISGSVLVGNGTLTLGNNNAIGSGRALTVNNGVVDLGGGSVTAGAVTLGSGSISNGTLTSASGFTATNGTISANLAGAGSLTVNGASVTLSGTNTYSGATSFKATNMGAFVNLNVVSTSALSANSTLQGGRNYGLLATNPTINLMGTGTYTMKNISANSDGSANLIFTSTNAMGTTAIEFLGTGGVLNNVTEGNERAITAQNVTVIFDGGTDLNATKTKAPVWHLTGNGNFDFKGDITSQNNSASMNNTLVLNGTGTTTLRGNNSGLNALLYTYSGSTLELTGDTNLAALSTLTLGGGINYTGASATFTNALNLGGASNGSSAAVSLVQNGSGTVAFTGAGGAIAAARTVTLSGSTAGVGSIAGEIADGASTNTGVATTFIGSTTLSFAGTASPLTNGALYNLGVGAVVSGAGIAAGTTVVAVDLSDSTNAKIVLSKATTDNILAGQSLSFAGSTAVTKNGTGTWALSGNNTYTGATTINGGTLAVNGNNGSSAVTVNSGGALGGSGTVGAVTVNSGGTIAPGNSPGTLTVASSVWNAGGNYNWQLFDANGVAGTGYDSLSITGALDLSALSGSSKFNVNLWSLSATDASGGEATNFSGLASYQWTLATFGSLTGSFNASAFTINTNAINGTGGFANNLYGGTFAVTSSNNSLFLNYSAGAITSTNVWSSTSGNLSQIGITNSSELVMAGAGGSVTNNAQVASLSGITFSNSASSYTLSGSAVTNGSGGIVNNSSAAQTVSIPLVLGANQTINAASGNLTVDGTIDNGGNVLGLSAAGANALTVGGVISGNGNLAKIGNGTATLTAANTFNGNTLVAAGTLLLNGGSVSNSAVTVGTVATPATLEVAGGLAGMKSLALTSNATTVIDVASGSSYGSINTVDGIAFGGGLLLNIGGLYTDVAPGVFNLFSTNNNSGNFASVSFNYNGFSGAMNNNLGDLMVWQYFSTDPANSFYVGVNLNTGVLTVVPEPSTYAMFAIGLGAVTITIVRRRRQNA